MAEESLTHEKYAIKKIICHGLDDQRLAVKEIEYHSMLKHPNVIECVDSTHKGTADPVVNATSEVLLVLPYYHVSFRHIIVHKSPDMTKDAQKSFVNCFDKKKFMIEGENNCRKEHWRRN